MTLVESHGKTKHFHKQSGVPDRCPVSVLLQQLFTNFAGSSQTLCLQSPESRAGKAASSPVQSCKNKQDEGSTLM